LKLLNKISLKNKNWILSLLFFPLIYLSGWLIISFFIFLFPRLQEEKSLLGTIISLFLFLIFLPKWSKKFWSKTLSQSIGNIELRPSILILSLLEISKAAITLFILSCVMIFFGYAELVFQIKSSIILESLFLGIIVGFAEELIFRVWLFEELSLFFNNKIANLLQAIIYAFIHLRSNFEILSNLQLFIGLFLLGLYLNDWRNRKVPSIIFSIGFHSALVAFWFLIHNSFLDIQQNIPKIIFGPGDGSDINPIGGIFGILLLLFLNFLNNSYFARYFLERKANIDS